MMPYLVWSFDYAVDSAGPKTLHRLCHELNEAGATAYVGFPITRRDWRTPFRVAPLEGEWIAVYPEVVTGNPWQAPHVARWILNHPGKLGGDKSYDAGETLFVWSELFNDVGATHVLCLPSVETDIYTDRGERRSGALTWHGKATRTFDIPGAPVLTRSVTKDRELVAELLNRAELLYSFDDASGMNDIARLCGCPVQLIPTGDYTRAQYDAEQVRQWGGWMGLGWGEAPTPLDSAAFRAAYLATEARGLAQVREFIDITQRVGVPA